MTSLSDRFGTWCKRRKAVAAFLFISVVAATRCRNRNFKAPPIVGEELSIGSHCEDVLLQFPAGKTLKLHGKKGEQMLVRCEHCAHNGPYVLSPGIIGWHLYLEQKLFRCVGPKEREVDLTLGIPEGAPIWDSDGTGYEDLVFWDSSVSACLSIQPSVAGCAITMSPIPFVASRVGLASGMGMAHGHTTGHFPFVGFAPAWMMDSLCGATARTVGGDPNKCTRTVTPNETPPPD